MPSYPQVQFQAMDPFAGRKEGMNALAVAAQINETSKRTDLMANEDQRRQEMWAEEKELAPVKRIQAVTGVMSQFLPRMSQDQYSGWRQESIKRGIPEAMLPTEDTVKGLTPQEWETKKNEWAMAGEGFQRLKTAEALAKIQLDTHRQTAEMDTKNKEAQYARENNLIGRREQAELNILGAREKYYTNMYADKAAAGGAGGGMEKWTQKDLVNRYQTLADKYASALMPDEKKFYASQIQEIAGIFEEKGWGLDSLGGFKSLGLKPTRPTVAPVSSGYDYEAMIARAKGAKPGQAPSGQGVVSAGPGPSPTAQSALAPPPQNALDPNVAAMADVGQPPAWAPQSAEAGANRAISSRSAGASESLEQIRAAAREDARRRRIQEEERKNALEFYGGGVK